MGARASGPARGTETRVDSGSLGGWMGDEGWLSGAQGLVASGGALPLGELEMNTVGGYGLEGRKAAGAKKGKGDWREEARTYRPLGVGC